MNTLVESIFRVTVNSTVMNMGDSYFFENKNLFGIKSVVGLLGHIVVLFVMKKLP